MNLVDEQGNSHRLLKGSGGENDAGAEEWTLDFEPPKSTLLLDSLNLTLSIGLAIDRERDGAVASTLEDETPSPLEAELAALAPHDPRAAIIRAVIKKIETSKSQHVHFLFTLEGEDMAAAIAANSEEVASFTFDLSVPVITARIGSWTHLN